LFLIASARRHRGRPPFRSAPLRSAPFLPRRMSSVVTGKFQEDYPESYAAQSGVVLEDDVLSSRSGLLSQRLSEVAVARRGVAAPPRALTEAELRAEYEWIRQRLFGPMVGVELYEEQSDDFDPVYRDSVDEIAELWRDKFEARFGREPPIDLVDYVYPRRTLDEEDRDRLRKVLDAEYHRLLNERRGRGDHDEHNKKRDSPFLAIPKGISRK